MILSVVLRLAVTRVRRMSVVAATPVTETLGPLQRRIGFDPLHITLETV
jgi:hypothetical protein